MRYHFHDFELDEQLYQLRRGGKPVEIEPKVFDVLAYLLHHRDRVISKDELLEKLWPEQVVSETALTRCIVAARKAVGDDGTKQEVIETQHGRGYRFIASLTTTPPVVSHQEEKSLESQRQSLVSRVQSPEPAQGQGSKPALPAPVPQAQVSPAEGFTAHSREGPTLDPRLSDSRLSDLQRPTLDVAAPRRFRWWQVLLLVVVLVLGGGLAANWRLARLVVASYIPPPVPEPIALPLPDKPSLAVLPLVNLSGDTAQEYFSDGLTDDLINTLAQFPDLFIIARHSAFTYKGKTIKEQEVARELGVRYVLAGSVRRAGEQVRLNVQLVDATTGEQAWAERYDRPFTEIFALQDELIQKLATTLRLQFSLWEQGAQIRKTTENVEAYYYALRGWTHWFRGTKKDNLRARELFEKALTLDPQYAVAYANVGWTYYMEWVTQWNPDPQTLERALEYGQKAAALNDFYPLGHIVLAQVYVQKAQTDRALSKVERAITLLPNLADCHSARAEILMAAGRPTEALQAIQHAMRLNPHAPFYFLFSLGWALHSTEHYAESIMALKRMLALTPFYPVAYPLQAFNFTSQWVTQQSHDPKILGQAYDAAQNAIALSDAYFLGHNALGFVYLWQRHYDDAIAEFERAVALDESFVCGHMMLAYGLSHVGRLNEAVQAGERALSLKALPSDDRCLFGVASAYALAGRLEEAAALHLRMLKQFPNFLIPYLELAALYSELGREAEAQAAAAEVLRINPQFSLEVHKERSPHKDPAMLDRHIAALRKAGLK